MVDINETKAVDAVVLFLERRGYQIIEKSLECPAGTIDIVTTRHNGDGDECLAFVDVRFRKVAEHNGFSSKERRFSWKEQTALAESFLMEHDDITDMDVTFDIVNIHVLPNNRAFIELLCNAHQRD